MQSHSLNDSLYKLKYFGNWPETSKIIQNNSWVASGGSITLNKAGRYLLIANGDFKTTTESVVGIKVRNNRTGEYFQEAIRKSVANQSTVLNFVVYGDFVSGDSFEAYFYNGSSASVALNNRWITAICIA